MKTFKIWSRFTWHLSYGTKCLQFIRLIGEKLNHEYTIYSCNFKLLPTHTMCNCSNGFFLLLYCNLNHLNCAFLIMLIYSFFTLKVVLLLPLGLHNYIILQMRMPIFHDVFVKLMIIYFFQDQCIAKLESLGFRIGQSLVERYFSIYTFKIIS